VKFYILSCSLHLLEERHFIRQTAA